MISFCSTELKKHYEDEPSGDIGRLRDGSDGPTKHRALPKVHYALWEDYFEGGNIYGKFLIKVVFCRKMFLEKYFRNMCGNGAEA